MLKRTTIEIDSDLLLEAMRLSGFTTKKAIVTKAVEEFVTFRKRKELLEVRREGLWDMSIPFRSCR